MSEDLKPIARGKAIKLEHDRRIKRSDVAMPDVVRHPSEEDVRVTAFECLRQWQLGNAVLLAKILAQKQSVNPGRVAPHDHVLIVVRENLPLNEITRAQQLRNRPCLAHAAERASAKLLVVVHVSALQFPSRERGNFLITKSKVARDVSPLEPRQRAHSDIVKLREQKRVHEMAAIDCELRIIDCFL